MPRRVITIEGLGHGDLPIPLAVVKDGLLVTRPPDAVPRPSKIRWPSSTRTSGPSWTRPGSVPRTSSR
jgi:hypothetical protein